MTWSPDDNNDQAIVRFEGRPNEPDRPGERSRWERFKTAVCPWLKKGSDLGQAYAEAEVAKARSEAAKVAAEAVEIAAQADLNRQQAVQMFGEAVDDIFNDDSPEAAKMLKLAKLFQENPELSVQVEKIKAIMDRLHLSKGVNIDGVQNQLAPPERQQTESELVSETDSEAIDEELMRKLNMPVSELHLSVRSGNCLESAAIRTVADLIQLDESDLLTIPKLGKPSLREVKRKLEELGLSLGMRLPHELGA